MSKLSQAINDRATVGARMVEAREALETAPKQDRVRLERALVEAQERYRQAQEVEAAEYLAEAELKKKNKLRLIRRYWGNIYEEIHLA